MWVKETSTAGWSAFYGDPSAVTLDGSCSSDLGNAPQNLLDPYGNVRAQTDGGTRWEEIDSSSGSFTISIAVDASVSCTLQLLGLMCNQYAGVVI